MSKNTVNRSCTAGIPDFLPRQKDPKNQAQQKEDMWPEINPWSVMFSVLGAVVSVIPDSRTETETVYYYRDNNY
ncbi:hypothetical protein KG383_004496 [Salmonella enterica subsp. enterica serovar Newport]|nr:hypothetical protein [Salmonella enterica subsp. enterica serovar Newport]